MHRSKFAANFGSHTKSGTRGRVNGGGVMLDGSDNVLDILECPAGRFDPGQRLYDFSPSGMKVSVYALQEIFKVLPSNSPCRRIGSVNDRRSSVC
jgi:hypothetical protein